MDNLTSTKMNDGNYIPNIGLGTLGIRGIQGVNQITTAINNGFRHLDTSTNYDSEGAVGEAVKRSSINREDLFITSKLPGKYHHHDDALKMLQESLLRMNLDYLDLYLIHWPLPKRNNYVEAWQALIEAQKLGLVKSIGVANFEKEHLDKLIQETGVVPAINQNELHPYWPQPELIETNHKLGIVQEAWSPLMRGRSGNELTDPAIIKIAKKHNKNVGQIILRWLLQQDVVPVVKAASPEHQRANLSIRDFILSEEEMNILSSLVKKDGRIDGQDPNEYEEFV